MKSLDELIDRARLRGQKRCVVAGGDDPATIKALGLAIERGLITPVLVGERERIELAIGEAGFDREVEIVAGDPAREAVEEVKKRGDFLLKGRLSTPDFLRAVLSPDGLRRDRILSHIALLEIPSYHKLIFMTDGGMNVNPDLRTKIEIIKNAIELTHLLGITQPKIAILSASEMVDPKIRESVDAHKISEMYRKGDLTGGIISGPLSLDLAISREAATKKGIDDPVAGDADILIVPDVSTGNIFAKGLIYFAQTRAAGIVWGATRPVVMLSRADPPEMKLYTIALGVAVS
ncbi:phosphate butyryltransferase [candidate division WOR-3 bacterium]|uniref:Phosphate butyryltransferase n=1 Tax=candidate division WOR-3 bacterium TaxID=2052148 RepID=A0A660SHA1_UNCW3|nr:MAG: phosphate butyryltransferase [candidate division WOR-3 bacterium]